VRSRKIYASVDGTPAVSAARVDEVRIEVTTKRSSDQRTVDGTRPAFTDLIVAASTCAATDGDEGAHV
jgi:hypothetical protein